MVRYDSIRQQAIEIEEIPAFWPIFLLVIVVSAISAIAGIAAFDILQSIIWL